MSKQHQIPKAEIPKPPHRKLRMRSDVIFLPNRHRNSSFSHSVSVLFTAEATHEASFWIKRQGIHVPGSDVGRTFARISFDLVLSNSWWARQRLFNQHLTKVTHSYGNLRAWLRSWILDIVGLPWTS
ncbi:mfs transporter [Moniliophthora roreri]|nr:mfs transporter [Moniliophthora roreri]